MILRLTTYLYFFFLPVYLVAQNPWINEIHYDNVGTDMMEYVEIVIPDPGCPGPISVERYNGNGGLSYGVSTIDGMTGEVQSGDGMGCIAFDGGYYTIIGIEFLSNGLQNGPDGIAIQCGTFVQFLTYEGSFTATDGIASGMMGADIGVSESSSTDTIFSAQLQGIGSVYSNFSWVIDSTTHCAPNLDQTILEGKPSVRVSGDLFLHQSIDGVILKSPDGTCYRISVDNAGVLETTLVACPGE